MTETTPPRPADVSSRTPIIRDLPPEEWDRLRTLTPFDVGGLPNPAFWRILVIEVDQQIRGYVCLWTAIHCEPLWLDDSLRHHPKLFMDLWVAARAVVQDAGAAMVFSTVDDDRPDLQALWQKFGFVAAPGRLFIGDLDQMP